MSESRIDAAIAEYLQAAEVGAPPQRDAWLAKYPDLQAELEQFLADQSAFQRIAEPLDPDKTVAPILEAASDSKIVRYFGDYELIEEIARGGMGVVWKARQVSLNRLVAVKMILAGQLASEADVQRFHSEAEAAANLDHPNILPIYEVGTHEGQHYFSMKLIESGRKSEVSDQKSEVRDKVAMLAEVARAVHFAHQRGILHRDLKPANILEDQDGTPYVADFGLAKKVEGDSALTQTGAIVGTPGYMAPEQARAEKQLSTAVDVYSLGAILYELLTGQPPFKGATHFETIRQVLENEPEHPQLLNPSADRDLSVIALKCLEKDAGKRYASADALAEDLNRWLADESILARPIGVGERVARWTRKRRRAILLTVSPVIACLLVGVAAMIAWKQHQEAQQGRVLLTTEGPNLLAEVLESDSDGVVTRAAVPTIDSIFLPEGSYRLRLSASGLLSETWPLHVAKGTEQSHPVRLRQQLLWPPIEETIGESIQSVSIHGRTDLILISPEEWRLRRISGSDGKSAWPNDLKLRGIPVPSGTNAEDWQKLLASAWLGNSRVMRDAPDLNHDGAGDLVLTSRTSATLLAISGQDGNLLWLHEARPPAESDKSPRNPLWVGAVFGDPLAVDVDQDGTTDLITVFEILGPKIRHFMEAVSGKTGKTLWQTPFPEEWFTSSGGQSMSSAGARSNVSVQGPENFQAQLAELRGEPIALFLMGLRLVGVNLRTGQLAWPAREIKFSPIGPPQFADLDGDGQPEAVLSESGNEDHEIVHVISLASGRELWQSQIRPAFAKPQDRYQMTPTPLRNVDEALVADLDADGRAEIVLPVLSGRGVKNVLEMVALDGATGQEKWRTRCWRGQGSQGPVCRLIAGPDLDGDSCREIFAVWAGAESHSRDRYLHVAAFSGRDGRVLWLWRQPIGQHWSDRELTRPLQWWQAGADGWPLLLVPLAHRFGGQNVTFALSAGTGKLAYTLPDVLDAEVADFNGDGIPDLSYSVSPQGAPRRLVISGRLPEPWMQLGQWRPAEDFDADGFTDLISWNYGSQALVARSGKDGRLLWSSKPQPGRYSLPKWSPEPLPRSDSSFLSIPPPFGDLDGDGRPDVVGVTQISDDEHGGFHVLSAISGHDGRLLWCNRTLRIGAGSSSTTSFWGTSSHYPSLDWCVLDPDRGPDLLLAEQDADRCKLTVLSARTGEVRWQIPFAYGALPSNHFAGGSKLKDLDGDGVKDLILTVPTLPGEFPQQNRVEAFSGRDGRKLWSAHLATEPSATLVPPPVAGDMDGDGAPEIVIIVPGGLGRTPEYEYQLVVLDGRDGKRKWSWSWKGLGGLAPLLVDFEGTGKPSVCIGIQENQTQQIVILSGAGEVRQRIPIEPAWQFTELAKLWAAADLDGDGREELLYANAGKLWASRGTKDLFLWSWPLRIEKTNPAYRPGPGAIVEIQRANASGPATVVMWSGRKVFGLVGSTGTPIWGCDVDWAQVGGMSPAPTLHLLQAGGPTSPPRVVCRWGMSSGDWWKTVCRQAWPTKSTGEYQPPNPPAMSYSAEASRLLRPLPWSRIRYGSLNLRGWVIVGFLGALPIYWAIRRRWRLVTLAVIGSIVATVGLAVWMLIDERLSDGPFAAQEEYSFEGWYRLTPMGVVVSNLALAVILALKTGYSRIRKSIETKPSNPAGTASH